MGARSIRLARAALREGGSDRPIDPRLRLVDESVTSGISHGVGHLIAEDHHLGGRLVTLGGRPMVNFGSCSYLGLETDLRLKDGAIDAVLRFGVQFASSQNRNFNVPATVRSPVFPGSIWNRCRNVTSPVYFPTSLLKFLSNDTFGS